MSLAQRETEKPSPAPFYESANLACPMGRTVEYPGRQVCSFEPITRSVRGGLSRPGSLSFHRTAHWFLPGGYAAYNFPSRSTMLPNRLCRAMAPTWFGRAPLHAAAICCGVLPVANARTLSPRLGELRLSPADFVLALRRRPLDRVEASVITVAQGLEAASVTRLPLLWRASTRSVAPSSLRWPVFLAANQCVPMPQRFDAFPW